MTTQELNKISEVIETVEDLRFQREEIIEMIQIEDEEISVKDVMKQMLSIVYSSNYSTMKGVNYQITIDELVEMSIKNVNRMTESNKYTSIDNGEINRENSKNNLPSSMR